ncbi:COX2 oxidase, partial [Alaudala cheleensis]|nr:COX2 oxidase [Alaudala cheleensis]
MPNHSQFGFQDASSSVTEELIDFHNCALMVVPAMSSPVLYLPALILTKNLSSSTGDGQEMELI